MKFHVNLAAPVASSGALALSAAGASAAAFDVSDVAGLRQAVR